MDITRWKSVAVKKSVHEAILALCGKYMGPGTYIEKLVDDAIEYEADQNGITFNKKETYISRNHEEFDKTQAKNC